MLKLSKSKSLLALVLVVFATVTASIAFVDGFSHSNQNNETQIVRRNWRNVGQQALKLFTPNQSDIVDTCLADFDSFHNKITVAELDHQVLITHVYSKPYITILTHWYEDTDLEELTKWGGPDADQELCVRHLEQLNERAERQYEEKSSGRDINLHQLLDTYGWYSTGAYLGNNEWPGEYNECLRLKIQSSEGPLATRYCSGAFKRNKWPKSGELNQILSQRGGICLPKSCDSARYKNKYELIERLVKFKARQVDDDDIYLDDLYCLPDEQSPLRLWYYSPKTVAFVCAIALWILVVVFATLRYEFSKKNNQANEENNRIVSLCKSLSLLENTKSLLRTKPTKKEGAGDERKAVNLDVVEGIKVITMCYVITSHVLMIFTKIMNNGREKTTVNMANMIFLSGNMLPACTVNIFFSITGLLTAYLMFKHSKPIELITSPIQWVIFVVHRYIRIMPLYLLVVMYLKYLAKYTGSGPFWDYGTTSLSHRRQCELEPWNWTLLFRSNFKRALEHCIPSAWYLANDFQFFLVTPLFLALIQKRPKLGTLVSVGTIAMGYVLTFARIATSGVDLRPMSKFMPHGFSTYTFFLSDTYTQPHYRIPSYLCGLLMGYALYRHEQAKLEEIAQKVEKTSKVDWPGWMKWAGAKPLLFTIVSIFGLPFIEKWTKSNKFYSAVLVASFVPTYHLLFAISAGLYVVLVTTGHGNKSVYNFLASPIWKPLSRVNLCAMLINIEVINYFTQTSTHLLYFDFKIIAALNLFSIVMSYMVATVVCVLFESPLRNLINIYLVGPLLAKSKKKHID